MTKIFNIEGHEIRKSQNLQGLLAHARQVNPETLHFWKIYGAGYGAEIHFENGDYAQVEFADWRVMADWFASRRSWGKLFVSGWKRARQRYTDKFA